MRPTYDEKYRSVISSAVEVFFRRGFAAGTTREVAERVGLTQSAIYHYIGNKDDILVAIARFVRDQLDRSFERGLHYGDTPREKLRGVIIEYSITVVNYRKACAVYWCERKHINQEIADEIRASQRGFLNTTEALIREAQDRGELPSGKPAVIAEAIFGMTSWTYQWYQEGQSLTAPEIAEVFCNLIGLGGQDR